MFQTKHSEINRIFLLARATFLKGTLLLRVAFLQTSNQHTEKKASEAPYPFRPFY